MAKRAAREPGPFSMIRWPIPALAPLRGTRPGWRQSRLATPPQTPLKPLSAPVLRAVNQTRPRLAEHESTPNAMSTHYQGRSADPIASAISGRALILASLLLLRRPW